MRNPFGRPYLNIQLLVAVNLQMQRPPTILNDAGLFELGRLSSCIRDHHAPPQQTQRLAFLILDD